MTTPLSGPPPPASPFPLLLSATPPASPLSSRNGVRDPKDRRTDDEDAGEGVAVEGWGGGSQETGPGQRPDEIQETEQTTAYPSLDRAHTSADPDAEPSLDPLEDTMISAHCDSVH